MEFLLVRHAEPEWVREGLSIDDPILTNRGHTQAAHLAGALVSEHIDDIFVSPLVRARQTADPLSTRKSPAIVVANWLEEIRSPVWQGTPADKAAEAFRAERELPSHERWSGIPGGEPVREFVDRIHLGALEFLAERGVERIRDDLPVWHIDEPGARIALVAHAGTNSVLICHLLGLDPVPWEWERFVLHHASVSRVEALKVGDGYTFSLTRLSEVEHLPPDMRTR